MDMHNQNINLMNLNQFNQNLNQPIIQNMNQNQFMFNNNNNQFNNMMQFMNILNNMNLNQQNLMIQNMNSMNLNQQNLMIQNINHINNMNLNQQNLINQNMNPMNLNQQNLIQQGMINQMNFINNNDINIPQNQVNLIISIISFYKRNYNDNMNYNNPIQIQNILNLINPNYPGLKFNDINKIEDPLYYIKAPKIIIKFINSDYLIYKVRIPKHITKYDLYTIAKLYKNNKKSNSDVLLIYQNDILVKDESSIELISEEDEIRIIEPRNYPDDSYYKCLLQKNERKLNIIFLFQHGHKVNFVLPESTLISDMIKAFKLRFGLENKYTSLIHQAITLNTNDNRKIMNVIEDGDVVKVIIHINPPYVIGKVVQVHISYTIKKLEDWIFDIGLLNSIKYIINKAESFHHVRIKKLFIGNKQLTRDDERCLSEIGISKNFNCLIEFEGIN